MTDVEAVLWTYLDGVSTLGSLLGRFEGGKCLYASTLLPAGYTPDSHGSAILFQVRGGDHSWSSKQLAPSWQFRCYGATEADARMVALELFDAVNDQRGTGIKWCRAEGLPQIVIESEAGWPYGLLFARFWMDNP
jgi:hypothetical protein